MATFPSQANVCSGLSAEPERFKGRRTAPGTRAPGVEQMSQELRRREVIKALSAMAVVWPIGASAQPRPAETASPPSHGQPTTLAKSQLDALNAYNSAVDDFKTILSTRRAQINSNQRLPNLPGQALYLARINMMSAYKDLTDAIPSKIGRPNKFGIPPAYFDADTEQLIEEYSRLFDLMEAPPANAQKSDTPIQDVIDLGIAIARAKGLDAANAEAAGRISLGLFFAETNGKQNVLHNLPPIHPLRRNAATWPLLRRHKGVGK